MNCWSCGKAIDQTDNYCRHCGKGQGRHVPYYYKQWGIIVLTLCAGPLSLFYVWRSPVLSKTAKWINAAVICAATYIVASKVLEVLRTLNNYYSGNF